MSPYVNRAVWNSMRQERQSRKPLAGFSLVELLIVLAIIVIIVTTAVYQVRPTINDSRSNAASAYVLNQIRLAHDKAVDERRIYKLDFTAPQTVVLSQGTTGAGGAITYNQVSSLNLPYDMQFQLPGKKPAKAPDGFGTQSNAVDFSVTGSVTGGGTTLYFFPDGSVQDAVGGITNGVVYLARKNDTYSARAVSMFGNTGRAKAWRLTQAAGGTTTWSIQ